MCFSALLLFNFTVCRVEDLLPLLDANAKQITFSSLRKAIRNLQRASLKLDEEKEVAERDLKKIIDWTYFPGRRFSRANKRRTGALRRMADWIKQLFGVPPPKDAELQLWSLRNAESWEEYLEFVTDVDEVNMDSLGLVEKSGLPLPIQWFLKAARRVSAANRKLIEFERGFIHEGGIKSREWYRHLGVAPGKWLGMSRICL